MGAICIDIATGRTARALDRLATVEISIFTLGAAEIPRLRAIAHARAGDWASAYQADRSSRQLADAHHHGSPDPRVAASP